MKITRLVLREVACFDALDLRFPDGTDARQADVHLLVGENGTGKSTILRALARFFTRRDTGLTERFRDPTRSMAGLEVGGQRAVVVREGAEGVATWFMPQLGAMFVPVGDSSYRVWLGDSRALREFAVFAYAGGRIGGSFLVDGIREPDRVGVSDAVPFAEPDAEQLALWITSALTREALARGRGDDAAARERREPLDRLEQALADAMGTPITFRLDDRTAAIQVQVRFRGAWVAPDLLPDGAKSVLSWLGDILMRLDRTPWVDATPLLERPFALFLDEIEAHLHPAWQWKVVPMVQALFPNAQIFVATHSPFVVASAGDAWIHRLYVEGDTVRVHEPMSSRAGSSYETVVREVLGVDEQFDPDTQRLLDEFYALRDRALAGDLVRPELEAVGERLRARSGEVAAIVVPELRMVGRRLDAKQVTG